MPELTPACPADLQPEPLANGYWRRLCTRLFQKHRRLKAFTLFALTAIFWLLATESGLSASFHLLYVLSHQTILAKGIQGTFLSHFSLETLKWQSQGEPRLILENLRIDWSPAALLRGEIAIPSLEIQTARFYPDSKSGTKPEPPKEITLPLGIRLDSLTLQNLFIEGREASFTPLATQFSAQFKSDGITHQLPYLQFHAEGFKFTGKGQLQGQNEMPLQMSLQGELMEHPLNLALEAEGTLQNFSLRGNLRSEESTGHLETQLTPFAAQPFHFLVAQVKNFDPARWHAKAPHALLDIAVNLKPANPAPLEEGLTGGFELLNRRSGKLQEGRLPLERLSGKISLHETAFTLENLEAYFPDKGRYFGNILLKPETMRQDSPFPPDGHYNLEITGGLSKMNPAFFSSALPTGQLNGTFKIASGWIKRVKNPPLPPSETLYDFRGMGLWQFALSFHLEKSSLYKLPFQGEGVIQQTGERVSNARFYLNAGATRLDVAGALGAPGETLRVNLNANRLEDLDFLSVGFKPAGDIKAELELSNSLRQPVISGKIQSRRLLFPQNIRLQNLRIEARSLRAETRAQEPMEARVSLDSINTPKGGFQNLELHLQGNPSQHKIRLEARLHTPLPIAEKVFEKAALTLAALGRFKDKTWHGEIETLNISPDPKGSSLPALLQLAAPFPLIADHTGFSLKNAGFEGQLQKNGWNARITELQLENGLWGGDIRADIGEIAPIYPLLGKNGKAGGHIKTHLVFSGFPEHPRAQGELYGESLSLFAPDLGLALESGKIALKFDPKRLDLETFSFDIPPPRFSPSTPPDRPQQEILQKLLAGSGSLEGKGYLRFKEQENFDSIKDGQLEFRAQHFGIAQKPDQWAILSGNGTLSLEGNEARIKTQLAIDGAYWSLGQSGAPELSSDVRVIRASSLPEERIFPLNAYMDIDLNLGESFYFSGAGIQSRLRGALNIKGPPEQLRAEGAIRTVDGRFNAYGQQLEVEQGILTFNGLIQNPALNIRAMRKNQSVEAGVELTGSAKKPVIRLISNPDVPDVEKLSWLVLGEAPEQNSDSDNATLMAAAHAILGGQGKGAGNILSNLQRELGLEVNIKRGHAGSQQNPAATSQIAAAPEFGNKKTTNATEQILQVGTQLGSGIRLSYEQSLTGIDNAVKLTIALTRNLSLVGQTGVDNALNIFYNFHFGRRGKTPETNKKATP